MESTTSANSGRDIATITPGTWLWWSRRQSRRALGSPGSARPGTTPPGGAAEDLPAGTEQVD